jgi:hypothetical protein
MNTRTYWRAALPAYLKISFLYFVMASAGPLAIAFLAMLWTGISTGLWTIDRVGVRLGLTFGGFFFVLALLTAIGADIWRNWGVQERTVAWSPELFLRNLIYFGALFFFVATFLSYHQGAWLSVLFFAFSIGSLITAKKCF